jgi:hypothetical protein
MNKRNALVCLVSGNLLVCYSFSATEFSSKDVQQRAAHAVHIAAAAPPDLE